MFVTVAICTFNRAESLRRTLASLAALQIPRGLTWEIVIVHNSPDHTDDVIREYLNRLPVRKELETQAGLSNARNQAIDTAKGEYIVWTDDDVIVDARWLSAYVDAFQRWPAGAVFGGRIKPRYDPPVTRWIAKAETQLEGPYAIRDFGDRVQPLSIAGYRIPFGANFAIRAKEQRAFRYDPNLGAAPNRPRADEETDVITRLLESGAAGYWIPEAIVEHCIGRDRQTVRYIAVYYKAWGETWARRNAAATATTPFLFGIPRRIWPRLIGACVLYHVSRWVLPAPVWVKYLKIYSWNRGMRRYWTEEIAKERAAEVNAGGRCQPSVS
jgi:glycosyltransferase involved in cell wall biosynthesis